MNLFLPTASSLVNHFVGNGTYSKPSGIAFGLTSIPPTNQSISEIANAAGYTRVNYGQNAGAFGVGGLWSFPNLASGIAYNNNQINFPTCTGSWGMVSGAFIADSSAYGGGATLAYCTLATAKDIELNDQFYIPVSGAAVRFY
jgi:hypothetical protein